MPKEVTMLVSDPFVESLAAHVSNIRDSPGGNPTQNNVRRPVHGVVHSDETYAYLSVKSAIGGKAEYVSIIDSSTENGTSQHNHNFLVNQIDVGFQEKTQIIQTFGQDYAFFYGQQPLVISVAGFLVNTKDFNWKHEWIQNYQQFLRGTACVRTKSRVYFGLSNAVYVGYLISTSITQSAEMANISGFSFQMLVTNLIDLTATDPRVINSDAKTDTGFTQNSQTGTRDAEYMTAKKQEPALVVDTAAMMVKPVSSGSVMPSLDSINSTWWLPEDKPLTEAEALRELSIRKYRKENSYWKTLGTSEYGVDQNGDPILGMTWYVPSRYDAWIAEQNGNILSNDPKKLKETESSLRRTCENSIIVVNK